MQKTGPPGKVSMLDKSSKPNNQNEDQPGTSALHINPFTPMFEKYIPQPFKGKCKGSSKNWMYNHLSSE